MKKIFLAALTMAALTASAQNDSIQVRMDFNANPWGYAVAIPVGTSWSKVDLDESPAEAWLSTDTDFTVDVNGKKLTMTVTPTDLDETDYDNCLFNTYDYDVDMSGDTRLTVLRMAIGSSMHFKAPEGYRLAKAEFETLRVWANGGLSGTDEVWTAETPHIYEQKDKDGNVTWTTDAWYGNDTEWHTPFCTGTTMLRYIDFWLLPVGGGNDPIDDPKPIKGDVNGDGKLTIEDITELIDIYLAK